MHVDPKRRSACLRYDEVERRQAYKREVCTFFETQSSPHPEDSLDRGVDHHLALHLPVDSCHLSGCQQV